MQSITTSSRCLRLVLIGVWVAFCSPARAEPPSAQAAAPVALSENHTRRFVPTVGLGIFGFAESLRLTLDGQAHEESRSDLALAPVLGLWHPLGAARGPRLSFDGHVSVGVGAAFHSGAGRVLLREDAHLSYSALSWLDLRGGLGLGFAIDTAQPSSSQIELALALSVTLFKRVELAYRPYVSFPLGHSESELFGGKRELSANLGFVPIDFVLRGRFRSLAW